MLSKTVTKEPVYYSPIVHANSRIRPFHGLYRVSENCKDPPNWNDEDVGGTSPIENTDLKLSQNTMPKGAVTVMG